MLRKLTELFSDLFDGEADDDRRHHRHGESSRGARQRRNDGVWDDEGADHEDDGHDGRGYARRRHGRDRDDTFDIG